MRNSTGRRRLTAAALAAAMALIMMVGPAAAAPTPEAVNIVSTMYVAGGPPNHGTFNASGSNLICADGTVDDTRYVWSASPWPGGNPQGVPLLVEKTFVCPDGEISLRLTIQGVYVNEVFTWVVLGGTGRYAGLHGQGQGWTDYSTFNVDGTVVNYYTGYLIR